MRYVWNGRNGPREVSLGQIRERLGNVSLPEMPSAETLASYDVFPLSDPGAPEVNPRTQRIVGRELVNEGEGWFVRYTVQDIERDELEADAQRAADLVLDAVGDEAPIFLALIDAMLELVERARTGEQTLSRSEVVNRVRANVLAAERRKRGL